MRGGAVVDERLLATASFPNRHFGSRRPSLTVAKLTSLRGVLGRVGTEKEWSGGKPLADTFLWRVHRTTARTVVEADLSLSPPVARDVEVWVGNQLEAMPAHMRFGLAIIAVFVTLDSLVRTGRPQWRLGAQARQRLLRRWATSQLAPVAQYVRLQRSLLLCAAHEHPDGLGYPR